MLEKIKAVIFDLDGTLVDSMWMWKEIDIEFLSSRGILMPSTLQSDIEGISFAQTAEYFARTFPLKEIPKELIKIWNEMAYDKYCNEVPLKLGAKKFLDYLKEHQMKVGIGTSNSLTLTKATLEAHRILKDIDCILTSNEVPKGKPEPDIYLQVAKQLQVSPSECLVFEDIPNGILAAKAAGMKVCAVEDEFSNEQKERKKELSDYYITSYEEVLDRTYEDLR